MKGTGLGILAQWLVDPDLLRSQDEFLGGDLVLTTELVGKMLDDLDALIFHPCFKIQKKGKSI